MWVHNRFCRNGHLSAANALAAADHWELHAAHAVLVLQPGAILRRDGVRPRRWR